MPAYSSYLRVYEPLSAFPPEERRTWESYVASGTAPSRLGGVHAEHRAALVAAIGLPPRTKVEHAFVHRVDGVTYVCPWRTELRTWEAIHEFRASLADDIADAFIPRSTAEEAEQQLARWRSRTPDLKSHIQSATFQVPLRWFVPFEGEERRLVLPGMRRRRGEPNTERSLTYLTTMANSRRRVARTLAVLRKTIEDGPIIEGVEDLGRWLEEYHPRSLVELDYGQLVSLFDDDELYEDESAADVAHAVASLANGDTDEAAEAYQRVVERWGAVRSLEVSN